MDIYKLGLDKRHLLMLPADDRQMLLFLAHVLNEVTILRKACLVSTLSISDRPHLSHAEVGQAMVYMRLLAAKLFEAWDQFNKRYHSSHALKDVYEETLTRDAVVERKRVNACYSEANQALVVIRKHHVFHFASGEDIEAAFQDLPEDEVLDFYLSDSNANSFYQSADVVANHAMLKALKMASLKEAIDKFGDQVIATSGALEDYFSRFLVAIVDKNFPGLRSPTPIVSTDDVPDIDNIRLPYFWSSKPPAEQI